MKRIPLIAVAIVTLWVGVAAGTDFTADRVLVKDGRVVRATLYCRDNMWRIEHNAPGPVGVTIVRKDKGVIWLLLPRMKQFVTLPYEVEAGLTCQHDWLEEPRREHIGTEILQGHPTTVSEVTVRNGADDVTYYEWWADDVHLPLRLARKDGAWIADYKNLRVGRLSWRLFELPMHYRPLLPEE